jgi:hypothetical protein
MVSSIIYTEGHDPVVVPHLPSVQLLFFVRGVDSPIEPTRSMEVTTLLNKGVYGFPEAARLAQIPVGNLSRWFRGRSDSPGLKPVLKSDIPPVGKNHAVSFLDLIDLRVVGRFRARGISMHTIRRVYQILGEQLQSEHPFAHANLKVFGKTVMQQVADEVGGEQLREVLTGQEAMPRILEKFLSDVTYSEDTKLAERWDIHRGVVVDPLRNLGKPISTESGAGTHVLAHCYLANNGNADLVADLFHTSRRAVLDAVDFEESIKPGARDAA